MDISQYEIVQISDRNNLNKAFAAGLALVYQEVFADPPYCIKFSEEEVRGFFMQYVNDGIVLLAYQNGEVIAFGAVVPLQKSTVTYLQKELEPYSGDCFYLADLGVRKDMRRQGIARQLVSKRLALLLQNCLLITRTTQNNKASRSLLSALNFKQLSAVEDVSRLRQDGMVRTDRRIFFMKRI